MNCPHCQTELIWKSDHDYEAVGMVMPEGEGGIVSCYECPKCPTEVEVYHDLIAVGVLRDE